jgi:tetratricopeptide (TPR) repeat protein
LASAGITVPEMLSVTARSIEELREAAAAFEDGGDWGEEALGVNEALIAIDPRDSAAAVRAARCLRALGRLDEAAKLLVGVASQDGGHKVARSQLKATMELRSARQRAEEIDAAGPGALLAALDAARQAEEDFGFQVEGRRLLAMRDAKPTTVCALAAAQRHAQDPHGARNSYLWAMALDDDPRSNAAAYTGLAAVLRDARDVDEAERLLRSVLRVAPDDPFARLGLAAVLMDRAERLGDRDRLPEGRTLLNRLWAEGFRGRKVATAFGRLRSLGG